MIICNRAYAPMHLEKFIHLSAMAIASVHETEGNTINNSKTYTVEIVSTSKPYDEEQLFKSIFESLYIINNSSPESCTEDKKEVA